MACAIITGALQLTDSPVTWVAAIGTVLTTFNTVSSLFFLMVQHQ